MGTISEKLVYLNGTKQAIKQAINEDFEVIDDNTTFREYADEISSNNAKYKDLIPKETKNATNTLDISNSSGLDKALVTQYGNTYQETTTGINKIKLVDKSSTTTGGVTYNINNQVLTLSGTSTGVNILIDFNDITLPAGTYYFYLLRTKTTRVDISLRSTNNAMIQSANFGNAFQNTLNNKSFTLSTDTLIHSMNLWFPSGVDATDNYKVMICTASHTASEYEKYSGGNPAPNPDYPQEIVNISGKSTLKDVGKNLFDKDNTNIINAYVNISVLKAAGESGGSFYIPCEPNTTYTVSKTELFGDDRFCVFDTYRIPTAGDTILSYVGKPTGGNSDTSLTITTNATATYLGIFVKAGETSPAKTFQEIADTIQVEKNSTASTYEAYKEQSFDLDLKSRNLFDNVYGQTGNVYTKHINAPSPLGSVDCYPINLSPNTQYTLKIDMNGYQKTGAWIAGVCFENGDVISLLQLNSMADITTTTFTTDSTGVVYVGQRYGFTYGETGRMDLFLQTAKIQLEKGSTATTYEPYYDINLSKIDTYKDRIYPLNGKWYLEKNINKVVFNGSEYWYNAGGNAPFGLEITDSLITISNDIPPLVYCDKFYPVSQSATWSVYDSLITASSTSTSTKIIRIRYTSISGLENFKTWLSTHNTILYYVLATPTTTEITESNYPTLYNQLNNIKLFEGVNHITMTNESGLDVEFDITYYKDWKLD